MGCCISKDAASSMIPDLPSIHMKRQFDTQLVDLPFDQSLSSSLKALTFLGTTIKAQNTQSTFLFSKKAIIPDINIRKFECPGCSVIYNSKLERPLTLPCGHHLCEKCALKGASDSGAVKCMLDLREFKYKDFEVDHSLIVISGEPNTNGQFLVPSKEQVSEYVERLRNQVIRISEARKSCESLEKEVKRLMQDHLKVIGDNYREMSFVAQENFESHVEGLKGYLRSLNMNKASSAIEQGILLISNEIKNAEGARPFEELSLLERLEVALPGPVGPAEVPEIDLSGLLDIAEHLMRPPNKYVG